MRNRAVATRYAQALLDTSRKAGVLDGVADSYAGVTRIYADNPDLESFLEGPQVADQEKSKLLESIFGSRIEPVLLHFFQMLLDKGRIESLADIQVAFQRLVEVEQGSVRADVVTAIALSEDLETDLTTKLASITGKDIILLKHVDPSVIGGVRVCMGDQVIDGTIRTNLTKMRAQLSEVDVR
ncbi:MAG: ATP synthase F1 subunit delta [Alphaproteobacteria bacterium]